MSCCIISSAPGFVFGMGPQEWGRRGDLEWLLEFLQNEISRREWSQSAIKQESHSAVSGNEIKGGPRQVTTAALPSLSSIPELCTLCSRRGHIVNKCYDLTKVPVSERKAVLKSHNLCFGCLRNCKGHNFCWCTVKCFSCKGRHHALLCDKEGLLTLSLCLKVYPRPTQHNYQISHQHPMLTLQQTSPPMQNNCMHNVWHWRRRNPILVILPPWFGEWLNAVRQ